MGVFAGLDTEAYDRTYSDAELIQRITRYFTPHKKRVWATFFFITVVSLAGAGQPLIVSRGMGSLEGKPSLTLIWTLVGLMGVVGVGIWLSNWMRRRIQARLIADVVAAMRHDAFSAAISHDLAFFDEFKSGTIISRITSDTQEFVQVVQL
ncbi:MAG: ABC transporter ATP-binding protein, partial [Anaerolineae bacterium]|nr:ABC transporter ATP-binding protein [Anaerolineae bacterium]